MKFKTRLRDNIYKYYITSAVVDDHGVRDDCYLPDELLSGFQFDGY